MPVETHASHASLSQLLANCFFKINRGEGEKERDGGGKGGRKEEKKRDRRKGDAKTGREIEV